VTPAVDLDAEQDPPTPAPVRTWHPYRAALVGVALLGLVAGSLLAGTASAGSGSTGQLIATLELRGVVLTDHPTAVLALDLQNVGDAPAVAEEVTVSGAGLVPVTQRLLLTIWPGATERTTVEATVSCSLQDGAGQPPQAAIQLHPAPGASVQEAARTSRSAVAVPVGLLARRGGLCSAADATLPEGWLTQARATGWVFGPDDSLRLDVTDLAADVTDVVAAQADGIIVPVPQAPVAVHGGAVRLELGAPGSGCQAVGNRPVVPTGLQLLVHTSEGTRFVYVAVDLTVADWLMRAFVAACPDSPGGPSAVRPLLGS